MQIHPRRLAPLYLVALSSSLLGCAGQSASANLAPAPTRHLRAAVNLSGVVEPTTQTSAAMGRRELSVRDAANFTNLEELVNGRYAGLEVRRVAGGALSLRVRDSRSTLVDAEPLLVLDGVAIGAEGASDMLASISPREVKRVELLKDAAATAYYGSRGANGVVIITTRRLD